MTHIEELKSGALHSFATRQTSHPGDMAVRRNLRIVLHDCGLPPEGDLFNRAYAYFRENYY